MLQSTNRRSFSRHKGTLRFPLEICFWDSSAACLPWAGGESNPSFLGLEETPKHHVGYFRMIWDV